VWWIVHCKEQRCTLLVPCEGELLLQAVGPGPVGQWARLGQLGQVRSAWPGEVSMAR
jgi:hypothetical protein